MGAPYAQICRILGICDPLIKMALIHHQFESIHPSYDGNGRTGRIINVLYLVKEGLLDIPVLYLSQHIARNKNRYYDLLHRVRLDDIWEDWPWHRSSSQIARSHLHAAPRTNAHKLRKLVST
jgi:Fic family protein